MARCSCRTYDDKCGKYGPFAFVTKDFAMALADAIASFGIYDIADHVDLIKSQMTNKVDHHF